MSEQGRSGFRFPRVRELFELLTEVEFHAGFVAEALERCWAHHEAVPLPDDFSYRRLRRDAPSIKASLEADRTRAEDVDRTAVRLFDHYHERLAAFREANEKAQRAADEAARDLDDDGPATKQLSIRIRDAIGTIGGLIPREHARTEWDSPLMQSRDAPEHLRAQIANLRKFQEDIRQAAMARLPASRPTVHVTNPLLSLEPPPQPQQIVRLRKALALALSMSEYLIVLVREGAERWEAKGAPKHLDWPQYKPIRDEKIARLVEAERQHMAANGEDPLALSDQVTWSSWATLLDEYAPVYQQWASAVVDAIATARSCYPILGRTDAPIDRQWLAGLLAELRTLANTAGPNVWRSDGLRVFQSEPPDLGALLKPALDGLGARLTLLVDLPFDVAEGGYSVTAPLDRALQFLAYLYDHEADAQQRRVPIHALPEEWREPDFLLYCQDQGWVIFQTPYSAAIHSTGGLIGHTHGWVFAGQSLNVSTLKALKRDLTDPHPERRVFVTLMLDGRRAVTEARALGTLRPAGGCDSEPGEKLDATDSTAANAESIKAADSPAKAVALNALPLEDKGRARVEPSAPSLRKQGNVWILSYAGDSSTLRNLKGVRYLARILSLRPTDSVSAIELFAAEAGVPPAQISTDCTTDIDSETLRLLRQHLADLDQDLAAADRNHDDAEMARLRRERADVQQRLIEGLGFGDRLRHRSEAEKVRKAVYAAIERAKEEIRGVDERCWRHIEAFLRTGSILQYVPEDGTPWDISF